MPRVYLAGPMRNYPEFNFPAFDAAAAFGRKLGWEVISPAEMDRDAGINEKETVTTDFQPDSIRVFIRRDVDALVNKLKAEDGDAIALLPGWQQSTGARGELSLALWAKLRVLNATTFEPMVVELRGYEIKPIPARFRSCSCEGSCEEPEFSAMSQIADRIANDVNWKP